MQGSRKDTKETQKTLRFYFITTPNPMINRLLTLVLLVSCLRAGAQSNYKEGIVVTSGGDTLKGFIDYRGWFRNPEGFSFKSSNDSKDERLFNVANTASFSIPGYDSYSSFVVSVSLNEIQLGALTAVLDTSKIVKAVFLKEILHGDRVRLYTYQDKLKERFYILSDQQKTPTELMYGKTVQSLQEFEHETYKQQLRTLALENRLWTEQLDRMINSSDYTDQHLKKIVERFNSRKEEKIIQPGEKNPRLGYFVSLGINKSKLKYAGESLITVDGLNAAGTDQFKDEVTTESVMPVLAAGIDFYTNPVVKRIVIRAEVSANKIKSTTKSYSQYNYVSPAGTENTYTFSAWNISFTPQVIYNFYTTRILNCFLGVGSSLSVKFIEDNTMKQQRINQASTDVFVLEKYHPLRSSNLNIVLRGGLQLYQRFECSVIWGNPTEYTMGNTGGRSIKAGQLIFSVGYLMNRGKR